MAETLAERLRKQRTRTETELDALGEGMAAQPAAPAEAPPPADTTDQTAKRKEKIGTGRDFADENRRRLTKNLNDQIEAARRAGNVDLVRELEARKKALAEM